MVSATDVESKAGPLVRPWRLGPAWLRQVFSALGQALTVALVVVIVTFAMVRLIPGDPATAILGSKSTPQALAALRVQLHLNESLPKQFLDYLSDLAHGNLGVSLAGGGRTVLNVISTGLPVTLSVVGCAMLFSIIVAVPLGLFCGLRRGWADSAIRTSMTLLLTMPPFFIGLLLLAIFTTGLHILPAGGWGTGWPNNLQYVILPAAALSGYLVPILTRSVRQSARTANAEAWVESGVARGLGPLRRAFRHVLPNSVLPMITLLGYNAGALIASAVIIEAVFGLPGIGTDLVTAISLRDYPVIQGIALVTALLVVAANLTADLLIAVVDPRIRRRA